MDTKYISLIFTTVTALLAGCAKSPIDEVESPEQLVNLELSNVGAIENDVMYATKFSKT